MKKILVISGPNLNMLGLRDKSQYGTITYKQLNRSIKKKYPSIKFKFFQSNYEGKLIDFLQKYNKYDSLIINAGAFTHTSIALRDCLDIIKKPKVSVHLSNINEREDFRKIDYLKDVVDEVFMGQKHQSYYNAIDYLLDIK